MSRPRTSRDDAAPITADDLARLRRNGPAALARRGPAHVGQTLASALQLALLGGVPLAGLTWYDWSAAHLLAYNVVGAWIGILADWARVAYAGDAVRRDAQTHYDDWHVWVVAGALRAGRTTAPRSHLRARHDPW
ncbi:MAG TPA: hypothetical protein PKC18_13665, partial [Lacipirellulaceae bacterium]|nr:hypothetical protein [Lacipirellulaceae bacterium]